MTKLLDGAIAELRALPPEDQDWAAAEILSVRRERDGAEYGLTDEQAAEAGRNLAALDDGSLRLVPEAEVDAFWRDLRR